MLLCNSEGKFSCMSESFGGACAPLLDSFAFQEQRSDLEKENKIVDPNKEKSPKGRKVGCSEQKSWSSMFDKKPIGKSLFLPVTA